MADLKLVVAAADSQSLSAVARSGHVSQSTVSRAVQRVEASLGLALFAREGRSMRLLRESVAVVDSLRLIVAQWEGLVALSSVEAAPVSLSVFCTVTASQTIVAELLSSFRRTHPGIRLELQTGPASAALDAVAQGLVDAAIAPLPAGSARSARIGSGSRAGGLRPLGGPGTRGPFARSASGYATPEELAPRGSFARGGSGAREALVHSESAANRESAHSGSITSGRRLARGLWAVEVATTPLIAVCALDIRGWADQPIILPRQGLTRDLADRWRKRALGPHEVQETDSHEEVVALAALGSGIGIVPKLVVDTSALRQRLRELTPPVPLPTMSLGLVVRDCDRKRPEIAALCSMVSASV